MKREMSCACCGKFAGKWEQHYNRDNGYGVCAECVEKEIASTGLESVLVNYGSPGYNFKMLENLKSCSLQAAHTMGTYAKKHGASESSNPFPMPKPLTRKLTQWDAWDSGYSGETYQAFQASRFGEDS